ncbi:IMP dehydrogenase/GMP reductase [Bradyrhizobium elkanii]
MPISTELTARLGIEHPILLAPMDTIAGSGLVKAVSDAGGFGILGGGYGDKTRLQTETAKLKGFAKPFGIGFITWSLARQPELIDIALEARPRAVMLSFGDPAPFAPKIKAAGALLICQVQSEEMAQQALDCGADILIAQGTEAGGHGASRTTLDIVPAIIDFAARRVPVVAAGGIADGRGLAAMMMLGASGVLMGNALLRQRRGRRGRAGQTADLRGKERRDGARRGVRLVAQADVAGAIHRAFACQRSSAALERARDRADAACGQGRGGVCRRKGRGQFRCRRGVCRRVRRPDP